MVARICCLALALGALVGCYDIPTPECGFACGPASECPSSYACNVSTNRCELEGAFPSCLPAPRQDGGTDSFPFPDTPDDFTAPTVTGMFPAPSSMFQPLTTTIQVTFSEPVVNVSEATVLLERSGGFPVTGAVTYDSFAMSATFQPLASLLPGQTYTVTVLDAIADLAGNPLEISTAWQFATVSDVIRPFVTAKSPDDGAINVGVGAVVIADFSEDVMGVTTSSMSVRVGATPIAGTAVFTFMPPRATFTPAAQLLANTTYTVSLTTAIEDTFLNDLVPVTWTFTTGADTLAPMVVSRSPTNNSPSVQVTTYVTASFDEIVVGISDTTFTLTPMGGSALATDVIFDESTRTAIMNPTLQLAPNTLHTATLTAAITDGAANALSSAPVSWTFTTGADVFTPTVASISPAHQATAVPTTTTIVIGFDEPVLNVTTTSITLNGGAITGTIAMSASNTIATFTPDAPLSASTLITIDLTVAITDVTGNSMVPVSFSFTTGP